MLEQHGFHQYVDDVLSSGFDVWPTFMAVEASDLVELKWSVGHRRKLLTILCNYRKNTASFNAGAEKPATADSPDVAMGLDVARQGTHA